MLLEGARADSAPTVDLSVPPLGVVETHTVMTSSGRTRVRNSAVGTSIACSTAYRRCVAHGGPTHEWPLRVELVGTPARVRQVDDDLALFVTSSTVR